MVRDKTSFIVVLLDSFTLEQMPQEKCKWGNNSKEAKIVEPRPTTRYYLSQCYQ
jgi:hypothetical protein